MFSERFVELKNKSHESYGEIAKYLGVTAQAVKGYSTGTEPRYELLIKLARHFGVSIDYLLGNEDEDFDINNNIDICKVILAEKEKLRLARKDFALYVDITIKELEGIERGEVPSGEILVRILTHLGIDFSILKKTEKDKDIEKIEQFIKNTENKNLVLRLVSLVESGEKPGEITFSKILGV